MILKKTKIKKIIILIVIVILILLRYFYIQLIFEISGKGGNMGSLTIKDSKENGAFIKKLEPNFKEIQFDKNYNIYIEEAWLEHVLTRKNNILWISHKPFPGEMFVNVKYKFKNKITNEYTTSVNNSDIVLDNLKGTLSGEKGENILYIEASGNPNQEYKYTIREHGNDTGYGEITLR
jgi:hypothetical protein